MWHVTQSAKTYLNRTLKLPASGFEQDWEIELSDSGRIAEFIDLFTQTDLPGEYSEALVALILASFEDASWDMRFSDELWDKFATIVSLNRERYKHVLLLWTASNDGDGFAISGRVSRLLA
ncbi:hypothetical protein [Rhizobium rhizogenes]|jgi:hypothetical protein|uniref:hypothetical protein n=1 Tax=Rhizobium rhizogenes TaxID=359 RepID=UPI00056AC318|nr:hypothetical protein [Rhizobium rhizogenes]NTF79411.1 hypothetical protein [Rhizobium rhizogenes]